MIRLAIVDDDVRLAKLMKSELLEFAEIESVITSSNGLKFAKDLEEMTPDKRPHIIIMDISMTSADEGIVATSRIKNHFHEIQVIMFTVTEEEDRIFEAFKAGAMGYLLKDEKPEFILKTILDVHHGGAQMSPSIARKTIQSFVHAPPSKTSNPVITRGEKSLTDQELRILKLVSEGHTYAGIGEQLFIATNTVKKHMSNIFQKLHVTNKIKALRETEGLL